MPTNSVLIVDDHELIRQGLSRAFERSDEFTVVAQAASVADGWLAFGKSKPDIVVTDVRLPDGTGLDLARQIRACSEHVGIVVLTMYAGDEQLFAAMEAGASSFVAKDAPVNHVLAAARRAHLAPRQFTAANLGDALRRRLTAEGPALTPREIEVLNLLAGGLGISAIAKRLYISESTTKTHVSRIYEKLGAANRAEAIMRAVRAGLLEA